jgi:hypothetical protein
VHVYIPRLSKKATLFRIDEVTIVQRGEEFKAMIEALLNEDAHSTIRELRTVPRVRDFFALWRRDKEAERRNSKTMPNSPSSPVAIVTQEQAVTQHLTDFVPTLGPSTPNAAGNSNATPHTSNNDDQELRNSYSATFSASTAEFFPGAGPSLTAPFSQSAPAYFPRSQSVPRATPNGVVEIHQLLAHDAGSRGTEPLAFLAVPHESAPRRPPIRKKSTPELSRLSLERRLYRDVSPLTRNIHAMRVSGDDYYPIPTPTLSRRDVSQRGGSRNANIMETPEERTSITPLTSYPFDHPADSPATPEVVGIGVGRARGRNLDSLAVLDPELYLSLSAQQALLSTSAPSELSQVISRARKTPPISDSAKRSAQFFVNDPNHGTGLVDTSTGPPSRSPISTPLTVIPDLPEVPALNGDDEQLDRKGLWFAQLPLGRLVIPEPHTHDPSLPHGKDERVSANSAVSGNSTMPTPSLPRGTSSWASPPSPISPSLGVYTQRYRSLGSVVKRHLSLDSLIASESELPYLSRNLAASRASRTSMSSDAIHMVPNALARSSVTPCERASSGQETSRESNLSYTTNYAQYYQSAPDKHESAHSGADELDFMPASPFTPSFNSSHASANYNTGTVQIKVIHAKSDIIVLFKVPRVEMTLADLRTKLRRKLREAGGPELGNFLLEYLPLCSDSGTTASTGARKRTLSAPSTSHMSMVDLDNEIEWQKALQSNTKIIMRII